MTFAQVRILDTPGLADTRGIHQNALKKKSIATEIQNHLGYVNAVLILANGSIPRISVSMDYALTTLSALFPKILADNTAFLLTNVPTPASRNFPDDAILRDLKHAPKFLIDNPIALQKNYLKQKGHLDKKTLKKIKQSVKLAEENALEMLVELFDWLDGLKPQPTTEIIAIHKKSEDIESKITATLIGASHRTLRDLAQLAEEYAGLSLAGCISGPLEKAVRLTEKHYESMENQGISRDQLEKMRGGLEDMKRRLDTLRKATRAIPITAYVDPESYGKWLAQIVRPVANLLSMTSMTPRLSSRLQ